ncbi:hypothetical protein [Nitrosomonas sp.]|uniref:hypothetical protein n=1 Tax=Nitrosomonas sp. TaxID=42353 RepID=UPI001D99D610|nr:hypothetical protein [Nitrosomonas sp.]MCB1949600.1 hypothetical protein [Nitrosomonas sp.]MCP5242388.1 hypothetical protein [Burkholderiales bacterium]MDR4514614.1 hypothetical protein [Nitrosomonas sp.]
MKAFVWFQICICVLLALFFIQSLQAFQGNAASNPEDLLVSYTEKNKLVQPSGQDIKISVYRDGYVLIVLPEAMRGGGLYHTVLEQEKLDALWTLLTDNEILAFDAQAVREMIKKERRLMKESRAVVTSVSDKTEIIIEIYPNRYSSQELEGLADEDHDVIRHIVWTGLRWDAEQYPHIESIRLLSEIQRELLSIFDRDDLQPIAP